MGDTRSRLDDVARWWCSYDVPYSSSNNGQTVITDSYLTNHRSYLSIFLTNHIFQKFILTNHTMHTVIHISILTNQRTNVVIHTVNHIGTWVSATTSGIR